MNVQNKKITYLLYSMILILTLFSLFAFKELLGSLDEIEQDILRTQAKTNSKNMKSLIADKKNSTFSIALVLSQNKNIKNFLLEKEGLDESISSLVEMIQSSTTYKSTWVHIVNNKGVSLYRSWTKKSGDNILKIRKDMQRMIQNPRIMNTISTGIFDMTFKSMVPIFENKKFIGTVEVITKFDSIIKKVREGGLEPIILVDKRYKEQLKKPYSKRFIDDYYVVNTDANEMILNYIEKKGAEYFWNKTGYEVLDGYYISYYQIPDVDGKVMSTTLLFAPLHKVQTRHLDYFKNLALLVSVSALIGFFLVLILIYNYLKRQEQHNLTNVLISANKKLEERVKKEVESNRRKDIIVSQQSRLVALGEMLGNIAHQWRQPLSAISTATSGLQIKYEFGDLKKEEFLDLTNGIMSNTKFLSDTIEDFRTFFQKDKTMSEFNLTKVINDTYNIIKALYNTHHIDVFFDLDESITYKGYQTELSQVLLNLFNNSKDALLNCSKERKVVYIKTHQSKRSVIIEFHDSAGGVSEENNERIFDPYFTTKHKSNGTGIGLYMSKEIVLKHFNGDIINLNSTFQVDNIEYYGANFIITLPKTEE